MGKSIEEPKMEAYLKKIGYEFVGTQYVPLVPVSPPTTQLLWLKQNRVDLAIGVMINPGGPPPWDEAGAGVKFATELQKKYRPNKWISATQYMGGTIEVMTQVEALRLAMLHTPLERLKPVDVLNNGFFKINNLNTGGISATPLTYGPGKIEGVDSVRVDQQQKDKVVKLGYWPCRHLYKH